MRTNRPGLSRLEYRVGTYASFLEAMQARLSACDLPALKALKTREKSDPAIALLDAWAVVGDVLTFYQERIANEGYLRTASERRSVLELARLIGYELRPGVAASVYLAYSLEKDSAPVEIPAGARANSIPAPGEQMQAFETAEPLQARVEWNAIKPRLSEPQTVSTAALTSTLYFKGIATGLKVGDPLLIDFADEVTPLFLPIASVEIDADNDRTKILVPELSGLAIVAFEAIIKRFSNLAAFEVDPNSQMAIRVLAILQNLERAARAGPARLAALIDAAMPGLEDEAKTAEDGGFSKLGPWVGALIGELKTAGSRLVQDDDAGGTDDKAVGEVGTLGGVITSLKKAPSIPPPGASQLPRDAADAYAPGKDTIPRLFTALRPELSDTLYASWKNLPVPEPVRKIDVYALRIVAAPFGHNAPLRLIGFASGGTFEPPGGLRPPVMGEWEINDPWNLHPLRVNEETEGEEKENGDHHEPSRLFLDNDYEIAPGSFLAVDKGGAPPIVHSANRVVHRSLSAYGLSGKTLEVKLSPDWIGADEHFSAVRNTRVFAGPERLELAEIPILDDVEGCEIELEDLYDGVQPGRWMIVAGERSDIASNGVKAAELVMIAAVEQRSAPRRRDLAGDKVRTIVKLAACLAYRYKRDTVSIYGNVVRATHGETRQEVLGSGDATKGLQQFTLKQSPLTYVSAPTVSGVKSTLAVRVNSVEWHQAPNLAALGSADRKFIARTDDDSKTSIVFGDGERGARLPTGIENVSATYRNGIGKAGNVKAGQISLLASRPLGVKDVVNPIRASGGADRESRDQARKNAPLALMALDRLVSTRDYADFARTFAGVGKAAALRVPGTRRPQVQVAIAGVDDAPIEETSDLYRNLTDALTRFGDPYLPVALTVRSRLALVIAARVRIEPDYRWDLLEPHIRSAVLARFGFDRVELGEDLLLSDAIAVMQSVRGVAFVDVDIFDTIDEKTLLAGLTEAAETNLGLKDRLPIEPQELAYLAPDVPDSLILQELKP